MSKMWMADGSESIWRTPGPLEEEAAAAAVDTVAEGTVVVDMVVVDTVVAVDMVDNIDDPVDLGAGRHQRF